MTEYLATNLFCRTKKPVYRKLLFFYLHIVLTILNIPVTLRTIKRILKPLVNSSKIHNTIHGLLCSYRNLLFLYENYKMKDIFRITSNVLFY